MTENLQISDIQNKIYSIRGYKVILDSDLSDMYGVPTKVLNQAVRRNFSRFPGDFMFQLTKEETENLRSQFVTSSWGGSRYLPNVFTEHGVAMLSSVLRSEVAIHVNIAIIRAFVTVRQAVNFNTAEPISLLQKEIKEIKQYLEDVFNDQNDINEDTRIQIELINHSLAELQSGKQLNQKPRKRIGFITEVD
jgi:hypothetical protein